MEYARVVLMDEQSHVLMYSWILLMTVPSLLTLLPLAAHSVLFACRRLEKIVPVYAPGISGKLLPLTRRVTSNASHVVHVGATMEIYVMLLAVVQVFTANRNLIFLIVYYQYLRMRYLVSIYMRGAFSALRIQLDGMLVGKPLIGTLYVKIRGFLERQGAPPQPPSGGSSRPSCVIM
jgi:Transmembrane protein 33/Nucleoporin POM33